MVGPELAICKENVLEQPLGRKPPRMNEVRGDLEIITTQAGRWQPKNMECILNQQKDLPVCAQISTL